MKDPARELFFGLFAITGLMLLLYGAAGGGSVDMMIKVILVFVLFNSLFSYGMVLENSCIIRIKKNRVAILGGYTVSFLFLLMNHSIPVYGFWMVGITYIAAMVHPYIGMVFQFLLTVIFCILYQAGMEYFFYYFMLGVFLCFLLSKRTDISVISLSLAGVSLHCVFLFLLNSFQVNNGKFLFFSLVSTGFAVWFPAWLDVFMKEHKGNLGSMTKKYIKWSAYLSLEELMDQKFELYRQLKEEKEELYLHSHKVSELAEKVAREAGCNAELAKAGGFYHEIGRMGQQQEKDYIIAGIKIAEQYRFPPDLRAVIRQHNAKKEKPETKEAAIVLLADSIVSTIEFMQKKQISYQPKEITEQIIQIRVRNKTFEHMAITEDFFHNISELFVKNAF